MATDTCAICSLADQKSENSRAASNRVRVTCARCGIFEWEPFGPKSLPAIKDRRIKLSAFVREQNAVGIYPFLQAELIQQVEKRSYPRLRDRALHALAAIVQEVGYNLQSNIEISTIPNFLRILAISYSEDRADLDVLLKILAGDGFITGDSIATMTDANFRLTPAGLIQAEELSSPGTAYFQGFVAMSFDPSMNEAYTYGFHKGIEDVGYKPFRIDGKEHINGISDEILTEIRRSKFLVADYTYTNNGVYFEAGVAVGLGIPVIASCRADFFDKLHFDIRHINTLKWTTPTQLAGDLAKRISGVIGVGPLLK